MVVVSCGRTAPDSEPSDARAAARSSNTWLLLSSSSTLDAWAWGETLEAILGLGAAALFEEAAAAAA